MQYRWQATVYYRVENNTFVDVTHDLEEIGEIHDRVESGPHWDTIQRIEIRRVNHIDSETLTLAEAANL